MTFPFEPRCCLVSFVALLPAVSGNWQRGTGHAYWSSIVTLTAHHDRADRMNAAAGGEPLRYTEIGHGRKWA